IGVNIDSPDPLTVQGGFPQVRLVRDANTDQGLTLQGGAGNAIYDSYNVGGNTFPQHTFRTTNDTTSEDILNLDYSNGSTFYTGLTVGGITTFKDDIETDHFSDWVSANPTGFQVSYDGTGDFRTVLTDELNAKAFTADVAQALAGSDFLTKSVAKLASDFVVPAVGSTVTIKVEDLEGLTNLQTFEASDWVRFRVFDRSGGGLRILDVYGTVSNYVDNTDGTQDWTFTVDYAGASGAAAGMTIYKGSLALDYGQSGDTYIERTVLDRSSGSDFSKVPYDRIVKWTGSDPRTGTKEVLTQTGNINGLAGYSTEIYGFYATDTVFIGDRNDNFMEYANGSMNVKADDFNLNANSSQLLINSGPPTIMTRDNSTGDRVYFGKTYSPSLSQYGSLGINMINENSGREFFRLDSSERHISHWD